MLRTWQRHSTKDAIWTTVNKSHLCAIPPPSESKIQTNCAWHRWPNNVLPPSYDNVLLGDKRWQPYLKVKQNLLSYFVIVHICFRNNTSGQNITFRGKIILCKIQTTVVVTVIVILVVVAVVCVCVRDPELQLLFECICGTKHLVDHTFFIPQSGNEITEPGSDCGWLGNYGCITQIY